MQCFNTPRASAFDYNLLEPLQKLLRLSSPVAAALARVDMFSGIMQKLNHKKAVIRLNLLRIVRSICDPSDDQADNVRCHPIFEVIQRLAENDSAVLVRNMATELVKSNFDKDSESGSGRRSRTGRASRKNSYTPPSLHQSVSSPMTPSHISRVSQSSAFIDGSVTPRRTPVVLQNSNDSIFYRPKSQDGPQLQMMRRTSAELPASSTKSRLPRTSMLRTSRSSIASSPARERDESMLSQKESRMRLRDQPRSTPIQAPGGTAPQLNSKRRARQPSGDIKWS